MTPSIRGNALHAFAPFASAQGLDSAELLSAVGLPQRVLDDSDSPFVRSLGLACFDAFACNQGLNPASMLRQLSLPVDLPRRPEGILSFSRFCALLQHCSLCSGNPLFGLEFGLYQGTSTFGPLLYLIRNARTVGDALAELSQHLALQNGAAEVRLQVSGEHACLSYHVIEPSLPALAQAEEVAMGVGHQLMRMLVGEGWQGEAVHMSHAPLAEPAAYRARLGLVPQFNADCLRLIFPAALLQRPLHSAVPALHQLMADHLAHMDRLTRDELPNYVRQLLRSLLPSGRVTLERVADCMAFSPRTLQRHLTREGSSFQQLLDDTRQQMARHYLQDQSISMAQLANLLGYADLSSFCRAFQRWFARSPSQWRSAHHPGLQPRMLRGLQRRLSAAP